MRIDKNKIRKMSLQELQKWHKEVNHCYMFGDLSANQWEELLTALEAEIKRKENPNFELLEAFKSMQSAFDRMIKHQEEFNQTVEELQKLFPELEDKNGNKK